VVDTFFRNPVRKALGMIAIVLIALPTVAGDQQLVNKNSDNIAIEGYDTVAYFTAGRPVIGKSEFEHVWQDAQWRFSNASNRDMFAANPERFAPHYGGYCAMSMARGLVYKVDPEAWVIVKDKLYLNYSKQYADEFAADPEPEVAKADTNWLTLGKVE